MNLIEQHMENVSRELAELENRLAQLKAEQDETRKLVGNIKRYRKSLCKQYPSGQAVLPLADPDEEPEALPDMLAEDWEPTDTDAPPPSDYEPTVEEYQASREPAPVKAAPLSHRRKAKAVGEE